MSRSRIDALILAIERVGYDDCVTAVVSAGYSVAALVKFIP
jgi:hypothetical protein